MKKLLTILLSAMILLSVTGCAVSYSSPEKPWPWGVSASTGYEKTVYNIVRTDDQSNKTIATGTLTYTLSEHGTIGLSQYDSLKMDMTLTYNDNAEQILRGKTDTIESEVIFASGGLTMYSSYKKAVIANRGSNDNGEYLDKSYTINTNYYTDKNATMNCFKLKEDTDGKYINVADTKTLDFSKVKDNDLNGTYDNDFAYYIVRALKPAYSTSGTFKLGTPYDMFIRNEFFFHAMSFSCVAEENAEIITLPNLGGKFGITDTGNINAVKTTLSITNNDAGSGPPTTLWYSTNPFKNSNDKDIAASVLVKIETKEYSGASAGYTMTYTLNDFSITAE